MSSYQEVESSSVSRLRRIEIVPTSIVEDTRFFKCMYCCEFYRLMSLV
ncbi:hypothetical protein AtEden1_Chr1g0001731 [Arabidopsis thaliana]